MDALPHLDRDLLPILQRRARAGGTGGGTGAVRLNPEVCKLLGHLKFRARLTRGLKTEAAPPATAWA